MVAGAVYVTVRVLRNGPDNDNRLELSLANNESTLLVVLRNGANTDLVAKQISTPSDRLVSVATVQTDRNK